MSAYFFTSGATDCSTFIDDTHRRVSPRTVTAPGLSARPAVISGVGSAEATGTTTTWSSTPACLKIGVAMAFTEVAASPLSPMRTVNF